MSDAHDSRPRVAVPKESRASWPRRLLHRFVPAGFHDPVGLARRLLRSGDPAAMFAMRAAALAPLVAPFDLLLMPLESARYRRASPPSKPVLFVCGCARSGTTVTAQLLLSRLPVSFLSNLAEVFPRSPLTAEAAFGRLLPPAVPSLRNFYGRTSGWSSPSDALHVWDRWLGSDRTRAPAELSPQARDAMIAFFGAREEQTGRPSLAKANVLNLCAHLVAQALPTARFICVERPRIELAMSLLKARIEIHGRADIAYGIAAPAAERHPDPVEDVCRQVMFHEAVARRQLALLGPSRFQITSLDEISRRTDDFVDRVAQQVLGERPPKSDLKLRLDVRSAGVRPEQRQLAARIGEVFERLSPRES